jgi:hypothetical protein
MLVLVVVVGVATRIRPTAPFANIDHERSSGRFVNPIPMLSILSMYILSIIVTEIYLSKAGSSNIANWWRLQWKGFGQHGLMVFSTFVICRYMNECTSKCSLTGHCYSIDRTLRKIFIRFGLILNLKMSTASAIVDAASNVCTPTDYTSRIGFPDWFRSIRAPNVFRIEPGQSGLRIVPDRCSRLDGKTTGVIRTI